MVESGNFLSVTEAAGKLGITRARVHQLLSAGSLPAQKIGHNYVIREADLALMADRKPGRPSKKAVAEVEAIESTRESAPVKTKAAKKASK